MTEPTKEQVWKEEARKAYQDQQSQDNEGGCREPIGFVQGYLAAKKSDFEELQKTREDIKNGYHEAYGLDSDLTIDELRDRVRLMHSWVKQHQYAVESFNNIKNQEIKTLKEQLAVVIQLLRRIRNACSPSDIMNCEQELEDFLKKQDKENKDEK